MNLSRLSLTKLSLLTTLAKIKAKAPKTYFLPTVSQSQKFI